MSDATAADSTEQQATWQRVDSAPDLKAWALITAPVHPSRAEAHPSTAVWGEMRVDPGLSGLDTGRARPTRVDIGRLGDDRPWPLPVDNLVPCASAWHPGLPLVAGLTVRGRHAHPWIADYRARTVRLHNRVRLATSLTGLGGSRQPPLVWCGDSLIVLTPSPAPAVPEEDRTAVAFEAKGPGWLAFPQGVAELATLAAVRVAALDPGTGDIRVLTEPLLVRTLDAAPGGGHALIGHLDERHTHSQQLRWASMVVDVTRPDTRARPAPTGAVWAAGAPAVLAWRDASDREPSLRMLPLSDPGPDMAALPDPGTDWQPLWHDGTPWALGTRDGVPCLAAPHGTVPLTGADGVRVGRLSPCGDTSGALLLDCQDRDGRLGIATLDPAASALAVTWAALDAPTASGARRVRGFGPLAARGLAVEYPTSLHLLHLGDGVLHSETVVAWSAPRAASPAPMTDLLPIPGDSGVSFLRLTLVDAEPARPGPLLLWLRAHEPDGGRDIVSPQSPGASRCAYLDMAPDWPADATSDSLHTWITGAVHRALDTLAERLPDVLDHGVVVGGHSFGATLALHALAHVPRFEGAIVHSGCYNRTLTPAGFQYERRSYWEAPEVYQAFSALLFAHRLHKPVLLVHGTHDTNPATTPEQALGLYRGIVAAGGHCRLVLLSGEGHNFQYAESRRTLAEEHGQWLARCTRVPERV
ncbi:alpha/beta hydrolase family protein [Streptomyces sp. A5-4]|uniref:alpha/beta hydrolase family protein n=1 Tax=Streptomyces sp. A5-4 TaxID=3384771 RepID=UPI003DA8DAFA